MDVLQTVVQDAPARQPSYSGGMGRITVRRPALRLDVDEASSAGDGEPRRRVETLAVEEPMELRVDGQPMTTTMRTPGDDFDLTLGFLHAEGVVTSAADVALPGALP